MTEGSIHYPNAPIVEAIFEIEAAARFDAVGEAVSKAARAAMDGAEYPEMQNIVRTDFQVMVPPGPGAVQSERQSEWFGVRFPSADNRRVVQFHRDGVSFHRLAPYTSYEDLLPQVQNHWATFCTLAQPRATTRQALRFVNRIMLPEHVSLSELSEYARITPAFALEDKLLPESLLSRVQLLEPGTNHRAFVSFSLKNAGATPLELIFDVNVNCDRGFDPKDPAIWTRFNQLRDLKNRLFHGSLHQKCLDLFK